MTRRLLTPAALIAAGAITCVAATGAAAPTTTGTPSTAGPRFVIDDFAHGGRDWTRSRTTDARAAKVGGQPVLVLRRGSISRPVTAGSAFSFDLRLSKHAAVKLTLGPAGSLALRENGARVIAGHTRLHHSAAPGAWYRVEIGPGGQTALDGHRVSTSRAHAAARLVVSVTRGQASLRAYVATSGHDAAGLLLQRLAWLHARTPLGKQPIGTGRDGRLRFSHSWTRGFWPGALWQAYDMTGNAMFARWARGATLANFGAEHADTHDVGFMYERSSAAAFDRLCARKATSTNCKAFRRSGLSAANSLVKLERSNRAVGTIPTRRARCRKCRSTKESDTIIDSVMNLPLLYWAWHVTGNARYRNIAARHAHVVAARMVRADGSTWSSMHNRRSDGHFIKYDTHQGYRVTSTWARGQAWAIYGFATAAQSLGDRGLLTTAQRTTRYVMRRLPTPKVPRYDYDAPARAPRDVSAGVITAAGMLRLAAACEALAAPCDPAPAAARSYAQKLLTASLARIGRRPPLGFLGHQVYGYGGSSRWDDDAELVFGIDYALEALNSGG